MANGDPLAIGITQPPFNRADSGTLLVHNGSAFGTQHTAFWVQRLGAPACSAVIRGDNFSTPVTAGIIRAGVMGMGPATRDGIGVLGTASAGTQHFFQETGVMGITNSFGVIGRALLGLIVDQQGTFISGTGVVGQCDGGVGVHGVATSGFGIIGQSVGRAGVTGKSVNGVAIEGISEQGLAGVRGRSTQAFGVIGESRSRGRSNRRFAYQRGPGPVNRDGWQLHRGVRLFQYRRRRSGRRRYRYRCRRSFAERLGWVFRRQRDRKWRVLCYRRSKVSGCEASRWNAPLAILSGKYRKLFRRLR